MNAIDMQVPDEDDRHNEQSRSDTINAKSKIVKERVCTLNSSFRQQNSKIVKERNWINPLTSKVVLQPLDTDTDAHVHEQNVISVRKEADFASRILQEKCPKWSADTLETLRRDEVSGRDQGCAENCSDSTSAKVSTAGPDDDSQQGPEHIEARSRADSRTVAR